MSQMSQYRINILTDPVSKNRIECIKIRMRNVYPYKYEQNKCQRE